MKFETLRFMRIVFETRFHGSLFYEDQRKGLFQDLTEKFSEIRVGPNVIEVRNPQRYFKLFAEWNRAGSSMEDITNFANFRDETHNFLTKLYEALKIKKMRRTGVRFFYVLPSAESYFDLKQGLTRLCYREQVIKAWGDKYDDMALVLVYKDGDNIYQLTLGAVEGEEVKAKCNLEYDIDNIPERGVLFDVDYYNMGPEITFTKRLIDQAHKLIKSKIEDFSKLLEE
jgi:hypothetical protein